MLLFFYRIAIGGYSFGIRIASLFKQKANLFIAGRRNWRDKLLKQIPENDSTPSVWFHCASLGEFEQGRPVLERIREIFPNHRLVLTFFSPSGYEVRKGYAGADVICYLPIDSPKNARDFVSIVKPAAAFFVKYEYWYFYLITLKNQNVPTYVVSAIFRNSQLFFKPYGQLHRQMLSCITTFFVQNEASKNLLASIGFHNSHITGDTRYDRVLTAASQGEIVDDFENWRSNCKVLVAGSTWKEDEELLCKVKEFKTGELKLIVVPHEVDTEKIASTLERFGPNAMTYSSWKGSNKAANCIVVDTIGLLMRLYRYADVAYVGGGFGSGIHNTLEPAVYGAPVIFGPNHSRFQEAMELLSLGGAFSIASTETLQNTITNLLNDDKQLSSIRSTNKEFVSQNAGATQRILDLL